MYFEEYGKKENPTIIMLHGAFFADTFKKQYSLSNRYHLVLPHIKGFGKAAREEFIADDAAAELKELIKKYAPVNLIGFSLGAQLAFRLISEEPELFNKAVIVSPWLVDKDNITADIMNGNLKMLSQLKNKLFCRIMGLSMGLPKQKRKEFLESMQLVSEMTVKNSIDNNISFETLPEFAKSNVPILALAGEKEPDVIVYSVKHMAELNEHCVYEVWEKAKHNIPTMFAKRFNQKLDDFFGGV